LNIDITTTTWVVQPTDLFFNREIKTYGGPEKGIYRFDGQTLSTLIFPPHVKTHEIFDANGTVTSLSKGADGNLWIASYGGVIGYDGDTFEVINDTTLAYHVRKTLVDSKGNLWIGNNGIGVLRYDGKTTTKLTDLKAFNFTPYDRVPLHVFALEEDKFGNIWIGDRDTGAWRFDGKTLVNYTSKDGLASNFVRVIYKDKKGDLWFGQSNGRVSRFNGVSFDRVFN
jgi:ligand-binding sensor domain-containing protein